jgi:hypothetical protein
MERGQYRKLDRVKQRYDESLSRALKEATN